MDKKIMKDAMTKFVVNSEVTVNFRGEKANLSGNFTVTESKTDKGKKGSRKASLRSTSGNMVNIHTRDNAEILNIVVNGEMFGSSTDDGTERMNFETDETRAAELKEMFKTMKEGQRVTLSSTREPTFNGTFTVRKVTPRRGKHGQISLTLENATGSTVDVWSFRSSGIIDSITVG